MTHTVAHISQYIWVDFT